MSARLRIRPASTAVAPWRRPAPWCFSSTAGTRCMPPRQAECLQNPAPEDTRTTEGAVSRRVALASVALLCAAAPSNAYAEGSLPGGGALPDEVPAELLPRSEEKSLSPAEKQVLALNKRVQAQNRAPIDFPSFVRNGFAVKVIADGYFRAPEGYIYKDFESGTGKTPEEGQQVVFEYTGYNESGSIIDTSYKQGRPAETRLGVGGLIPGFEMGLRTMRVGGKRRIVVPPELGPPVGPSTFFSAKQCEVFDVELEDIRSCRRQQVAMFSSIVCE